MWLAKWLMHSPSARLLPSLYHQLNWIKHGHYCSIELPFQLAEAFPSVLAITVLVFEEKPFSFQARPPLSVLDPHQNLYVCCLFSKRQPLCISLCISLQAPYSSVRSQTASFCHYLHSAYDLRIPFTLEGDLPVLLFSDLYHEDPWTSDALNQLIACLFAYL